MPCRTSPWDKETVEGSMFAAVAGSRPDIVKPCTAGIRMKSPSWSVIGSCPSTARRHERSRIAQ
jgi:hypothetical protein